MDINELDNGGYNVGYMAAGEYLRYTVDVTKKSEKLKKEGLASSAVVAPFERVPARVINVCVRPRVAVLHRYIIKLPSYC